jgi:hypothetical protein
MRRPAAFPALLALWISAGAGARAARAGETARYDLRGELGAEYDSNAHRTEIIDGIANAPIVGSPLGRASLSGHLVDAVAEHQQVAVSATLAGKLFTAPAAHDEDVLLAATSARWRVAVNDKTGLGVQASDYEAFQRASNTPADAADRRDFRSLTPALTIDARLGSNMVLAGAAGYRSFVFKSDLDLDFHGPVGSLDLRWTHESADGSSDWELTAGANAELRAFSGLAATGDGSTPTQPRQDTFLVGRLDLTRAGRVLLGGGYALQWNDSNSYGDALTRHVFALRFATALPLGCYLAARGELILAQYHNPVALGQNPTTGALLSIDDENRNSLRVDLSRALTERLQLLARYTLYANEIGLSSSVAHYRRQTLLLSLAFTLDN